MASYLPILLFVTLIASVSPCSDYCKPMFTAALSNRIRPVKYDVFKFDKIISQCGDDYNPATGTFTAVIPGFYGFAVSVRVERSGATVYLRVMKNGVEFSSISAGKTNIPDDQASNMAFVPLEKGDKVLVKMMAVDGRPLITSHNYTTFSGWMV